MVVRSVYLRAAGAGFRRLAGSLLCLAVLQWLPAGPLLAASDDENFFTHLHTDKVMANVTVSPGRAGPVDIAIQLQTVEELPLAAKAVSVTLTEAQSGKKLQTAQAVRAGEDRWHLKVAKLTSGRWTLGLGISISDTDKVNVEAPILIASGAAKGKGAAAKHHHH